MAQYDINLRDYLRILRRRKGIIILVPLIFGAFSFGFALLQAPRPLYRTTAVVKVERSVNLTGLLQELVTFTPVGNVETQAALIKSFPVMSLASKKLGLIPTGATREEIQASPKYLGAINRLQDSLSVKLGEGTSLIEISVTSYDPEEAVRFANSVADAFQEDNFTTRSRQVREAREFIERQLGEVGATLRASENEIKGFKQAHRIFLFPEETKASLGRLGALEAELAVARRSIDDTQGQLELLKAARAGPRPGGFSADGADPALAKLLNSLADLTAQRDTLLVNLRPAHPQVKQLEAQIANVEDSIRAALSSRLQTLRARADEIQRTIATLRQEQATIPEAELQLARMERDIKVSERLFSLLKEKHQEALIREKEQVGDVSLVKPAILSRRPINPPQAGSKAAAGLVIGLVLGLVLAFVVEALDTSIGAIDDVESFLESPVLGVIPHLDIKGELSDEPDQPPLDRETEEKYAFLISLFLPNSRAVEAMRALRTNLLFTGLEQDLKMVMVTSATPMEGKTTIAINLAILLAQLGKRTLLIEADLRNPYLHHAFGIPKEPGFTDVVIGSARIDEAILTFSDFILGKAGLESLIERPGIDNLFLLPSGHQPPNPTEFLSAQALTSLLAEVRQRYDFVILDCAPVLPVADPTILGSRVDGTLLVVRVGSVARAALRRAKALLEAARARVLGVCLTGVKAEVSPDYAEMGYYRYRYGARRGESAQPAGPLGRVRAAFTDRVSGLVGLSVLLVALAAVYWAVRLGYLTLTFLSTLVIGLARLVGLG
ncbi:MAG TPA: AAA family ATPase [Methylomirabilota bacterium]|nr:AAA family ATPase [Methylomirabilota bacterium]